MGSLLKMGSSAEAKGHMELSLVKNIVTRSHCCAIHATLAQTPWFLGLRATREAYLMVQFIQDIYLLLLENS